VFDTFTEIEEIPSTLTNAFVSIEVTELGIEMEDRVIEPENAFAQIVVTELGIVYDVLTSPI